MSFFILKNKEVFYMNYFEENYLIDISNLIKKDILFYAHIKENEKETLINHIDLCNKYFLKIFESKSLKNVFLNFEKNYLLELSSENINLFRKMLINVVNFHDIGKINPLFQSLKMNNQIKNKEKIKENNEIGSKHSILSSVLYINNFIEDINSIKKIDKRQYKLLTQILFINSYIISRHHGKLNEFYDFCDLFDEESYKDGVRSIIFLNENYEYLYEKNIDINSKKIYRKIKNCLKDFAKNKKEENIYLFTYIKLLHSLLVASDFYATSEFMENIKIDEFGDINDIQNFYNDYKKSEIYKKIREYEESKYYKEKDLFKEENINILRTEMFLDSEKELIKNIHNNIFFLESPTGSGKSNTSMNLSFKLIEEDNDIKKIYYVYPFNTLIEQNINSIKKIFNDDTLKNIAVINSITPIKTEQNSIDNEEKQEIYDYNFYSKALLDRQFLNYSMILTTHVSLFDTLFGSKKENSFSFHQLSNSVVVLDEIQSYKNTLWTEIITFLYSMSKILNIKIIIMSATLPDLKFLLDNDENINIVNLIKDREKYFTNKLFKERVVVNYDLIGKNVDDILNHIKNNIKNNKVLVEFIKKKTAYEFYYKLRELNIEVELLTGDDNIVERNRILDKINKSDEIILVSTQVIEAGVDIDMDIGYKDISKLDSEEQFMGRINRSCKKSGKVYFFDLDKANHIYKNDLRINNIFTLENDEMREILINKNFKKYYTYIMDCLKKEVNERLDDNNLERFFNDDVGKLNFENIEKRMKLIDETNYCMYVYLSRKIMIDENTELDGYIIWNDYKELLKNNAINYSEKQVKLSILKSYFNYFIYQIQKTDLIYNDKIGEIYFIEEGEEYFIDNKLDKEKLISGVGDFI